MEVLIVGAGSIGRWWAQLLGDVDVTFADIDPDRAAEAAERCGSRTVSLEADRRFDVVSVAVPMSVAEDAIERHGRKASRALIDLSGSMETPLQAMSRVGADLERISLHPLFSPANAPGNVAIVAVGGGRVESFIRQQLAAVGCYLVETTPEEHDQAMRTVQAKTHAAVLAYALTAEPVPKGFHTPVSDGMMALVEDVLSGTPEVYAEIQSQFPGADELARAANELAEASEADFRRLYERAGSRWEDQPDR